MLKLGICSPLLQLTPSPHSLRTLPLFHTPVQNRLVDDNEAPQDLSILRLSDYDSSRLWLLVVAFSFVSSLFLKLLSLPPISSETIDYGLTFPVLPSSFDLFQEQRALSLWGLSCVSSMLLQFREQRERWSERTKDGLISVDLSWVRPPLLWITFQHCLFVWSL